MKNFVKSLIFLGFFSSILCCAISRESGVKMPSEIEPADTIRYVDNGNICEYEMVEEIDLGENVYKVWFGKDEENAGKLKAIKKANTLTLYGSNLSFIGEKEVSRVYASPNAKYMGLEIYAEIPTKSEAGKRKFVLIDENGNVIWNKEYKISYDMIGPYYFVSDKGTVAEFDNSYGILIFYDISGNVKKKVQLFESGSFSDRRGIFGKFSGNGNYFVAGVNDPDKEIFSGSTGVILFESTGNKVWDYQTGKDYLVPIYISYNGNYIITSAKEDMMDKDDYLRKDRATTFLLGKGGNLIREYPGIYISNNEGDFSSSEKYVIIRDVRYEYAYLIETETGNKLSKFSLFGTGKSLKDVKIAEATKLIGITYDNKVELIQFNGVKAWSKEVSNPEDLWLSDDGSKITVRSNNKILRFEKVK